MELINFLTRARNAMENTDSALQKELTLKKRLQKRFSLQECADFLRVNRTYLTRMMSDSDFPQGQKSGREKTFTIEDLQLMRAIIGSSPNRKNEYIFWNKPVGEDKSYVVPIVSFAAQKGGTGKSLTAAHFAQYLTLNYGLRVGVVDLDPQFTLSLYFADDKIPLLDGRVNTATDFMGLSVGLSDKNGKLEIVNPTDKELDSCWYETTWNGIKLMPASSEIIEGDMVLGVMFKNSSFFAENKIPPSSLFTRSMNRWLNNHKPTIDIKSLRDRNNKFLLSKYKEAMSETFDVIIIDHQPALTLFQLNGMVSATSLVIPQTMKGFDLSTLSTFISSFQAFVNTLVEKNAFPINSGKGRSVILPTIVQEANEQDKAQILDLHRLIPHDVSSVWYKRSDAVANASEHYKSIYEYQPDKNRRASAKAFVDNANAVNDMLVSVTLPHLPSLGYEDLFVKEKWYD